MNTEIKRVNDLTGEDEYYTESNNTTKKSLISRIKLRIKYTYDKIIEKFGLAILAIFIIAFCYFIEFYHFHSIYHKVLSKTQISKKVNRYKAELILKNEISKDKIQIKADKNELENLELNLINNK
jgi:hypothetical protein